MNSQDLLIVNIAGVGAFVLWYLLPRGGERKPTRLDLNAKDSGPIVTPPAPEIPKKAVAPLFHPDVVDASRPAPKNLNVLFNYNGHSWDAYEVLGLPAGANMQMVNEAYQKALQSSNKNSVEFLETAYQSIVKKQA